MIQSHKLVLVFFFSLANFIPISVYSEDKDNTCDPFFFFSLASFTLDDTCMPFPNLEWMQIEKLIGDYWQLREHPDHSEWIQVWPHQEKTPQATNYTVLSIVSKQSKSYRMALKQLLDVFQQQGINTSITLVNIDKKQSLLKKSLNYAEEENYDLIFSMGSQSEAILHKTYSHGKIPVVTSTNKDPVLLGQIDSYEGERGSNIAYTSLNVPLSIQEEYLKVLKPNLKVIGLMYNKNHKQVMVTEVKPTKKEFKKSNITVIDVIVESTETAPDTLAEIIPKTIKKMKLLDPSLENTIFLVTSSTAIFSHIDVVNRYTKNIPVIATIPNAVTEGKNSAVIAFGIDRRSNAHQAALYAIDILKNGIKAGSLPVGIVTPPDISINFLVAKKIGLKIPFHYFENANFIYNYNGKIVRDFGKNVGKSL